MKRAPFTCKIIRCLLPFLICQPLVKAWAYDFDLCPENGRERLWAQKRLNADLMNRYIDEHDLRDPLVSVRVRVLDTGFDLNHQADFYHPQSLRTEPGVFGNLKTLAPDALGIDASATLAVSLTGDPNKDVGGHGTMVAAVIGGANGVGVAPHTDLTIMRITPNSDAAHAESVSNSFLDYAFLHACRQGRAEDKDGVIIINSSWAIREAEDGAIPLEKRNPALVKQLASLGCLVVQAAGNSAFVGPIALASNDSGPLLSVSATQAFNLSASFSSHGLIAAPGEHVFTLASRDAPLTSRSDRCSREDTQIGKEKTFVNGTSFSSPMAAGIAAEVMGVILSNRHNDFKTLKPQEKMQLLIRILEASSIGGSVTSNIDGLRAVLIAARWKQGLSTPELLRKSLADEVPAECLSLPKNLDEKRFFVSACRDSQDQNLLKKFESEIEAEALQARAFETVAQFLDTSASNDQQVETFTEAYLGSKINASVDDLALADRSIQNRLRLTLDASVAESLMPGHLRATSGKGQNLLLALLSSWSTQNYLQRGPGRGSEPILKAMIDSLEIVQVNLSDFLGSFVQHEIGILVPGLFDANAATFTTVIRVLNEISLRPYFQASLPSLTNIETEVLNKLNEVPARFGKDFDLTATQGEIYQNRPYIFSFLDRHFREMKQRMNDRRSETLSVVVNEYCVEHSQAADLGYLADVLNKIDSTLAWRYLSFNLAIEANASIEVLLKVASDEQMKDFFKTLNFEAPSVIKLVDHLAYLASHDLAKDAPSTPALKSEERYLTLMLQNTSAVAALRKGMSGIYSIRYLKASALGSRSEAFSDEFKTALSAL